MIIALTKEYGIVHYQGTMRHNSNHRLAFESNDAIEVMAEAEQLRAATPPDEGYFVAIRGVGEIGDATRPVAEP